MTALNKTATHTGETISLKSVKPALKTHCSDRNKPTKPTRHADHIEIACDRLLELGTVGISKTGAHALFSDGAFNTTVSKIKKQHGITLARELRTKTNKQGHETRPMFYWISNKQMASEIIALSNRLKIQRKAPIINTQLASILLSQFPE